MRDSTSDATPNALIHESSPYLRQHAYNPVDWQPWSEAVWEEARAKDKLVIVSIGYSACHWCHVMEHETFEDSAAAAFMNEHFVSIKVDREERPDVDGVYMTAVQLMTQRGGWPLNAILPARRTPDLRRYLLPRERWLQALSSILKTRAEKPERVLEYAEQLTAGVQQAELVDVPPRRARKHGAHRMPMDLPTHCCLTMASTGGGNCGTHAGAATTAPRNSPFRPTSTSFSITEPSAVTKLLLTTP